MHRVKRILIEALEHRDALPHPAPLPPVGFARDGTVFTHTIGYHHQSKHGDLP